MKIKTSELTGAALDWVYAQARGIRVGYVIAGPGVAPFVTMNAIVYLEDGSRTTIPWGPSNVAGYLGLQALIACKLGEEVEVPDELAGGL